MKCCVDALNATQVQYQLFPETNTQFLYSYYSHQNIMETHS